MHIFLNFYRKLMHIFAGSPTLHVAPACHRSLARFAPACYNSHHACSSNWDSHRMTLNGMIYKWTDQI
jgi:hypothetical protein